MGKMIFLWIFCMMILMASNEDMVQNNTLKKECLSCHMSQQIPNDLIYRRYLMVYSTSARMEEAIFTYMKNPDKKNSVMHHPFFFKFPMKEKLDLEDGLLKEMIKKYLIAFDVKKKFINLD